MSKIGIIGGSGLDDPDILEGSSETSIETPYGDPSSKIKEGQIEGQHVAILSRHGIDHSILPTNVNFRANIWALKKIGCTHILASTAVGSLETLLNRVILYSLINLSTLPNKESLLFTMKTKWYIHQWQNHSVNQPWRFLEKQQRK